MVSGLFTDTLRSISRGSLPVIFIAVFQLWGPMTIRFLNGLDCRPVDGVHRWNMDTSQTCSSYDVSQPVFWRVFFSLMGLAVFPEFLRGCIRDR